MPKARDNCKLIIKWQVYVCLSLSIVQLLVNYHDCQEVNPGVAGYQPGMQQPGVAGYQPGMQQPGVAGYQPGMQQPGVAGYQPGYQQPGMMQPGYQQQMPGTYPGQNGYGMNQGGYGGMGGMGGYGGMNGMASNAIGLNSGVGIPGQSCPPIELPPYARFLRGECMTTVGSRCYLTCNPGFDLIGSCFKVCGQDGRWSGSPMFCTQSAITCNPFDLTAYPGAKILSGCQNMAGFLCMLTCGDPNQILRMMGGQGYNGMNGMNGMNPYQNGMTGGMNGQPYQQGLAGLGSGDQYGRYSRLVQNNSSFVNSSVSAKMVSGPRSVKQYTAGGISSQYPQTMGTQYPQTMGTQYPQPMRTQYPQTMGTQYPQPMGTQYPQTMGTQYPQTMGSQYPGMQGQYPGVFGASNPMLAGVTILVCQQDGMWSGMPPTCPGGGMQGGLYPQDGMQNPGQMPMQAGMINGGMLPGQQYSGGVGNPMQNGMGYSGSLMSGCSGLRSPVNGDMSPVSCVLKAVPYETVCTIACRKGFRVVGPTETLCQSSGQWSQVQLGVCEPLK